MLHRPISTFRWNRHHMPTLALVCLALALGCSDGGGDGGGDEVDAGPLVCPGAPAPGPGQYAPECCENTDCTSDRLCLAGVCANLLESGIESVLTDPADDDQPSDVAIETSCSGKTAAELSAGLPAGVSVVMWGRVDRFGGGGLTDAIEIAVFRAEDFHPEACAGVTGSKAIRDCMHDEAKVGKPLAKVVSLTPEEGVKAGQIDRLPCAGACPTITRQPGDLVGERYDLTIQADAPPGRYQVIAGLYDLATGERLSRLDSQNHAVGTDLVLGVVDVQP